MKHQRSFTEILAIIAWVAMLFIVVASTTSCRTRKVDTQKLKSELSIDSTSKKSERKQEEKTSKTDSLGKEKSTLKSEKEIFSNPDSVKYNLKTGEATFYTHGKNFRLKDMSLYQNQKETLKTSKNASKEKVSKSTELNVKIDSAKIDNAKNVKTSGQSFGGIIAIALTCLVIVGVRAWRTR